MPGATDLLSLERNYQPFEFGSNQPQPKKKGSLLTKLLPAIGGAAGIALAPFTGGGSLALLGLGALGGAAGKVAENKLEGQGAFNNPGQIALEGLFGAGGGALTALKGARAAKAAVTADQAVASGGADTALNVGEKALQVPTVSSVVPKTSIQQRIANTSEALKGEARGIKPGVSVPGTSKKLTGQSADNINAYIDSLGGAKSAHRQYRTVQQDLQTTGEKIGQLVAQHDRAVAPTDLTTIAGKAADKAKNALGFNPEDQVIADIKTQLGGAKSLSELKQIRGNLDEALQNFYKQTERDSSTTATMKVVKGYRDGIDKVLTDSIPGFKDVNTRYATGLKASEQLLNAANPKGLRFFGIQTGVGGEGLQAAKDLAGRAVGKVANVVPGSEGLASKSAGNVMSLIKPVARQEAIHAGGNLALGRGAFGPQPNTDLGLSPDETAQRQQQASENLLMALTPEQRTQLATEQGAGAGGAAGGADASGGGTNEISYEQLLQLVNSDPKHADTYLALYKAQPSLNGASAKPLSASAATSVSNAETGIRGISDLVSMMQQDPSVVKRTLVPGRGLFGGIIGNAVKTNGFDAARQQVVDVIARLRTGAAISKSEETRFLKFLPQPFDSPTVAQQKLGYLERQFQRVAAADPSAANEIQQVFNDQSGGATGGLQ